jgi:hypothetical protein
MGLAGCRREERQALLIRPARRLDDGPAKASGGHRRTTTHNKKLQTADVTLDWPHISAISTDAAITAGKSRRALNDTHLAEHPKAWKCCGSFRDSNRRARMIDAVCRRICQGFQELPNARPRTGGKRRRREYVGVDHRFMVPWSGRRRCSSPAAAWRANSARGRPCVRTSSDRR